MSAIVVEHYIEFPVHRLISAAAETRPVVVEGALHYYVDPDILPYPSISDITAGNNDTGFAIIYHGMLESRISEASAERT